MRFARRSGLAALLTAASLSMVGCGHATPTIAQAADDPAAQPQAMAAPEPQAQVAQALENPVIESDAIMALVNQHALLMTRLHLTPEQDARIKLIRAKFKAQSHVSGLRAQLHNAITVLSSPVVNAVSIEGVINDMVAHQQERLPAITALAGQLRDVLTSEQRSSAIAALAEGKQSSEILAVRATDQAFNQLTANLNLNTVQTASLSLLKAKVAVAKQASMHLIQNSIAQFLLDGDQHALALDLKTCLNNNPSSDIATWAASLSQTQRLTLIHNYSVYLGQLSAKVAGTPLADIMEV
jgi:hypothetical protein